MTHRKSKDNPGVFEEREGWKRDVERLEEMYSYLNVKTRYEYDLTKQVNEVKFEIDICTYLITSGFNQKQNNIKMIQ